METDAGFSLFDINSWRRQMAQGKVLHYLYATIFVLSIGWLKSTFPEYFDTNFSFLVCLFAIYWSTYVGGAGPGILALGLSALIIDYLFLPPYRSLELEASHLAVLILFIVEGCLFIYITSKQRRTIIQKVVLERQKDDFISSTSHELKTPLTSMKIIAELLEKNLAPRRDEKSKKYATLISEQIERLISMVNLLLDLTRVTTHRFELKKDHVDLDRLVRYLVEDMQTSTTTHSIVLEGTLTKPVIGDTLRLSQVVSNILSNAVKYSPPGSMVRVDMKEEKDNAIVSIADSGIGIDKSHHTRIFDRFYRVDEKGSVFAGLGIGLYLSSEIIKRHGGKIWVESEIGKGATFCISLPTHKEPT